jgi:hypothetical protein
VAVILHLDEKIYPLLAPLHSALFRNIILTSAIGAARVAGYRMIIFTINPAIGIDRSRFGCFDYQLEIFFIIPAIPVQAEGDFIIGFRRRSTRNRVEIYGTEAFAVAAGGLT